MPRGHVRYDKKVKAHYVDLYYLGKRHRIYKYLGVMPCPNKAAGEQLKLILNDEINKDPHGWTPARHKSSSPLHFKEYSNTWIQTLEVSDATMHDYKNSLKNHILPALGGEYLPDITTDKLKIFQKSIKRKPKGKKNVMDCLKMILRAAERSGYIPKVPDFPKLKAQKAKIRYIEPKIIWQILNHIPLKHRPVFTFIALTGCRPSEARAFRWVDKQQSHIIFVKTFGRGEILKEVKGFNEEPFPIYGLLKGLLDGISKNLSPFVFLNPDTGKPYTKSFNKIWNKVCVDLKIKNITPRILRHSFGCNMLNSGVDKRVVQRLLRHTDSKMTDRYAEYSVNALEVILDNVYNLNRQQTVSNKKSGMLND